MSTEYTNFLAHLDSIGVIDQNERDNLINFAFPDINRQELAQPRVMTYYYSYSNNDPYSLIFSGILNRLYERIIEDEYELDASREDVKVPLNENGCKKLKYEKFNPEKHNKCDLCSICQAGFENGKTITILPCDHYFHNECIDPWFKNYHHICPLCRKDVNE